MSPSASRWQAVRKILIVVAVAGASGWFFGLTLLFVALALAAVLGSWLHQLWRIQQWLHNPELEPPEAPGIWGDITDGVYHQQRRNREQQQRLKTNIDFLTSSLAAMRDAVVIVTNTGTIQWCNDSAASILGLQIPRDENQAILYLLRRPEFHSYFTAENFSHPLLMQSPRDSEQQLQLTVTEFGDGNRLLFVRDVTGVTRMEKVRRDFVANVSHELRTPLTVITGYLYTFRDSVSDLDSRIEKPVLQMLQQAKRMESLLNDLLLLARVEHTEQSGDAEAVDIHYLLEGMAKEVGEAYPEHPLTLHIQSDHQVPGTYSDLYSAVSNLIVNAMKYSPTGAPVDVYWRKTSEGHCLSVVDQGIGIDPVHHPRLTERFYRVDKSRSTSTGGTGLGLAIVKHVVAAHNAQLQIKSAVGQGSTFTILFPCDANNGGG